MLYIIQDKIAKARAALADEERLLAIMRKEADAREVRVDVLRATLEKAENATTEPVTQESLDEPSAHLVGKKHVTTIDLSDAFFQIPLAKESQPLTAFYSPAHGKRYCFQRVPQGLRNSPLYLKLLMDKLFGDMANDVIHYADDIMLATDGSLHDHLQKMAIILKRLKEGKIKIRPSKINVARQHIEFLGVVWTKDKISIPEAKTLAFKNLPLCIIMCCVNAIFVISFLLHTSHLNLNQTVILALG